MDDFIVDFGATSGVVVTRLIGVTDEPDPPVDELVLVLRITGAFSGFIESSNGVAIVLVAKFTRAEAR
jgi:hypothetical protein